MRSKPPPNPFFSSLPSALLRNITVLNNSGLDELANTRIPFSDLREFLRVAVQNAIRDRDIPENDTLEEDNELETSGHTRAPSNRLDGM
ncbi:hypothetical protein CH63R_14572 [Colletotrichum higginsianum IMI 349063]|uniref:Uncharacterized protein n=1 Tax=Colletotrichum higginsianum (strain IMI 349063) TaxID=759273 RepID=A0A1B7XQF8_COLHI|nr:hypothetical protein CH63R_14572 [Colletotrichum higginsianum IMI 349063]OBR02000.1 hypothetical protein CH63R_14572 [Colletotrichum higginsianum IMI 349063]